MTTYYALANEDGDVVGQFHSSTPEFIENTCEALGYSIAISVPPEIFDKAFSGQSYYILNNELVEQPPKPSPHHVWKAAPICGWVDERSQEQKNVDDSQEREVAWKEIRRKRDAKLLASDWREFRPISAGTAAPVDWIEYRQALRDITQQADPFNIEWPAPPEA